MDLHYIGSAEDSRFTIKHVVSFYSVPQGREGHVVFSFIPLKGRINFFLLNDFV